MSLKEHRIAGLRIRRVNKVPEPPAALWQPKDDLPDLEPPEKRLTSLRQQVFTSNRITLSRDSALDDVLNPHAREEHHDIVARVTVYVMNITVMIMSLPVGLALLYFNIMGGENLRTTSHVMALTGMFIALAATPAGMMLFQQLNWLN